MDKPVRKVAVGPCKFCGWKPSDGKIPIFIYTNPDMSDIKLFCPECCLELSNQTDLGLATKKELEEL